MYSGACMGIGGIKGLLVGVGRLSEGVGGVRGNQGHCQGIGVIMGCRGVRGVLGAGRECRYSGQWGCRSIGGVRGHWGCRSALEVAGGLGAQPHWAPVQGPSPPTGSPWGVT